MDRIFNSVETCKMKDLKILNRLRLKKLQEMLDKAGEQMINFEEFFCYEKPEA